MRPAISPAAGELVFQSAFAVSGRHPTGRDPTTESKGQSKVRTGGTARQRSARLLPVHLPLLEFY